MENALIMLNDINYNIAAHVWIHCNSPNLALLTVCLKCMPGNKTLDLITVILQYSYKVSYAQGCGPPPVVENATAPVYSATLLGSTATYSCNAGFGINGSSVVVCQLSGWEATPQCVKGEVVQYLFIL